MSTAYQVWHLDGRAPEMLGTAADKGAGRRLWRNSRHVVITLDGVVLETKPGTGPSQLRALAAAAAAAHRAGGGVPPKPVHIGPAPEGSRRRLEVESRALRAVEPPAPAAETMPPRWPVEEVPEVEVTAREERLPEAVQLPPIVVRRRTSPPPAPQESPMPAAQTRCPCGAPSAPTGGPNGGGRPGTPEFADLCKVHRGRAATRRKAHGITSAQARADVLAGTPTKSAPKRPPSKPAPRAKVAPPKPSAPTVRAPAAVPVGDLLAGVRRRCAVVDGLGGLDAAERLVGVVARVGGVDALEALVDELARAVA